MMAAAAKVEAIAAHGDGGGDGGGGDALGGSDPWGRRQTVAMAVEADGGPTAAAETAAAETWSTILARRGSHAADRGGRGRR